MLIVFLNIEQTSKANYLQDVILITSSISYLDELVVSL